MNKELLISNLSDCMIYFFQNRHSGMDCRNPVSMDGWGLPSIALDTRFPAGMTGLRVI